ncbi:hypothetical protein BJV82DRAFT_528367, partial [Fennellomyces sp. T-0311]
FLQYVLDFWLPKRHLWCKAWRPTATFHTNNLIESWHSKLKRKYLPYNRNHRVDRVIYVLTQLAERDYCAQVLRVLAGIEDTAATINAVARKKKASKISPFVADQMIKINADHVCISIYPYIHIITLSYISIMSNRLLVCPFLVHLYMS